MLINGGSASKFVDIFGPVLENIIDVNKEKLNHTNKLVGKLLESSLKQTVKEKKKQSNYTVAIEQPHCPLLVSMYTGIKEHESSTSTSDKQTAAEIEEKNRRGAFIADQSDEDGSNKKTVMKRKEQTIYIADKSDEDGRNK